MSKKDTIIVDIIDSKPMKFQIDENLIDNDVKIQTKDLEFNLNIEYSTSLEEEKIRIILSLNAVIKESKNSLFSLKSTSIFKTPDFSEVVDNNNEIIVKDFLIKLVNICIGGIRGMIATYLLNTKLSHITVPLFDLSSLKENNS